eukprot:m.1184019 g.1184019  ORF g.1184019 m.1184019 type:complete len:584 (+) comp24540_c1_seq101:1860-3611(+)
MVQKLLSAERRPHPSLVSESGCILHSSGRVFRHTSTHRIIYLEVTPVVEVEPRNQENLNTPSEIRVVNVIPNNRTAGGVIQQLGVPLAHGEKPLLTPMVKDVFLAAYTHASASTLIWTNFDIIVKDDFYVQLAKKVKTHIGFSVLRLDVLINKTAHPSLSTWNVDDVYAVHTTRNHPGHDCFVFPTRWIPCLDYRNFAFGIGGWGYALVEEMQYVSHIEGHDSRNASFAVLHPRTDFSASGITRHIGKDGFGHAYHGTPDSWSGGLRRNQLAFNRREYAIVRTNMAISRDPADVCSRTFLQQGGQRCDGAVSTLLTCVQRRGLAPVVAVAVPTDAMQGAVERVVGSVTRMASASIHTEGLRASSWGRYVTIFTRSTNTNAVVSAVPEDADAMKRAARSTEDDRSMKTTSWDTVIVPLDSDPVRTIAQWLAERSDRGAVAETFHDDDTAVMKVLRPIINMYVQFYTHWANQVERGPLHARIVHMHGNNNSATAAQELYVFSILLHNARMEWCAKPPTFDVCCGIEHAMRTPPEAHTHLSMAVRDWIAGQVSEVAGRMHALWMDSRRLYTPLPNVSVCCRARRSG